MKRAQKQRTERVRGGWYDAQITYRRDARGQFVASIDAVRYRKRSWRYWRALALAVAAVTLRKVRGR